MHRVGAILFSAVVCVLAGRVVEAQEPPPRIGPFVVDLHVALPTFGDNPQLAESRALNQAELPGLGLGASVGAHVYILRLGPVTVGVGGAAMIGRSHSVPEAVAGQSSLRPVTETFKTVAPQLSLNFGNGNGWSYLSVGVGRGIWSIVPDGGDPLAADQASVRTIGYGAGARWFAKKHLAFSLDVRVYEIDGTAAQGVLPGSPRTLLLVVGAGIALK